MTNEEEKNTEFENFTNFVRQILKVPKSDIDESIRKERQQEKEIHKDPLEEKEKRKREGENS